MTDPWRSVGPGDLVAVDEPPGPAWHGIVAGVLESGAALFPLDARLTVPERDALLARARPTHALLGGSIDALQDGRAVGDGVALVVPTSGTSGPPKLVELSRAALESAVHAAAERIGSGRWLMCLPPAHIAGLLVLLRGVLLGPPSTVLGGFDVESVDQARDVEYVSIVPTQLFRLLEAGVSLQRFRALLIGAAPLAPSLARRAEEAGAPIVAAYGLTETAGGVIYGGEPLRDVGIRLTGQGIVEIRGPMLMDGYLEDAGATAAAYTSDGWLRTRDVATRAPDGRFTVHGRADDVIVTGGEKVWPAEVEAILRACPGVDDVAIAGRPDPEWGERVVAFVVASNATAPPGLDALRSFGRDALAGYKLPRELVIVQELPRTSLGKLERRRLP